jgi:hypothetical protein
LLIGKILPAFAFTNIHSFKAMQTTFKGTREELSKEFGLPSINSENFHQYELKVSTRIGLEMVIYSMEEISKHELILVFREKELTF